MQPTVAMKSFDQNLSLPLASEFGIYLLRGAKLSKSFGTLARQSRTPILKNVPLNVPFCLLLDLYPPHIYTINFIASFIRLCH